MITRESQSAIRMVKRGPCWRGNRSSALSRPNSYAAPRFIPPTSPFSLTLCLGAILLRW
jgi:hypothetical protein